MTTVFVAPEDFEGERVELHGTVHHHLFRVGRLAVGDSLRVANGAGRARLGVIERVTKKRAEVVLSAEVPGNEPAVRLELLVAAPRKPRADWLVEKATELGVSAVRFIRSERGPRSYGPSAFERLRRIAISAAEQCERACVPEISGMHERGEIEDLVARSAAAFVLDPSGERLTRPAGAESISVLIGPEGGWSRTELEALAELGVVRAGLGERILRVETAAIVSVFACVMAD